MPNCLSVRTMNLVVKMDKTAGDGHAVDFDTCCRPPKMRSCRRLRPNSVRRMTAAWSNEDSIRNAYVSMFMTDETARYFARRYKLDEDAVSRILVASRGNHRVIADFMARLRSEKSKRGGLDLLLTDFGKRPPRRYTGSSDGPHAIPVCVRMPTISADMCAIHA